MNTDDYEGHTEGPWIALHRYWNTKGTGVVKEGDDGQGNYVHSELYTKSYIKADDNYGISTLDWSSVSGGVVIENKATANLVAAAPDLLAEVKRLREETSILKNALRSLLKDKHAEVWYEVSRILEGDDE